MAAWLYPISKRAARWFILDDGTKLKVSVENYAKLVKNLERAANGKGFCLRSNKLFRLFEGFLTWRQTHRLNRNPRRVRPKAGWRGVA